MPTGIYTKTSEMYDSRRGKKPWNKGLTKETDERVMKNSEGSKNWNLKHPTWLSNKAKEQWENLSEKEKTTIRSKGAEKTRDKFKNGELNAWNKGQRVSFERHHKIVEEEIKNFEADGFCCLNLCKKPIPDFIAIKDGKPFAVEIQVTGTPNTKKYLNNNPETAYADIIWIIKRGGK